MRSLRLFSLLTALILALPAPELHAQMYVRYQEPEFLTFDELKEISKDRDGALKKLNKKLDRFWRTPIISNEAYYDGARPLNPIHPKLGPMLRVVSWNIEKSFRIQDAVDLFTSKEAFEQLINPAEAPKDSSMYKKIHRQRNRLPLADVILLQEMDIGVKRSGYVDSARMLAQALKMNYAYGTEALEIDPVMLGLEKLQMESGEVDQEATDYYAVEAGRYKGAFGCAVLSRYPIKNVEVFQLKNQAYDWYEEEKRKTTFLESLRRVGAEAAFKNQMTREIKVGGRIYFRVDLDVPGLPNDTLTIINIHLEIKCLPRGRQIQMEEILGYIRDIRNPVIMAGDFNSAPTDLSPTSVTRTLKRTIKNPTTWLSAAATYLTPHGLAINTTRSVSNVTKNFNNPLASHIPVIGPNPVKPMFDDIRNFSFKDGGTFDWRGDVNRSINGKDEVLANSNQRSSKGFKTSFRVRRPWGVIGKYRLDWFFVKSHLISPMQKDGPYTFAPHYGETLEEMNVSLMTPISDHHPIVIDLPFTEPKLATD